MYNKSTFPTTGSGYFKLQDRKNEIKWCFVDIIPSKFNLLKQSNLILFCYDVTNSKTLESIDKNDLKIHHNTWSIVANETKTWLALAGMNGSKLILRQIGFILNFLWVLQHHFVYFFIQWFRKIHSNHFWSDMTGNRCTTRTWLN